MVKVTLDHCHKTGLLRESICNSCNRAEGMVSCCLKSYTFIRRISKGHLAKENPNKWLKNLAEYLIRHEKSPSKVVHPTFDLKAGKQRKK